MNRHIVIDLINKSKDKKLNGEIDYFMEMDRGYKYDKADALDDAHDFAEQNNERGLIKTIRLILIKAGYLVEQAEKTDFGRDTRVTVNKVKYSCVSGWETWISE